MQARLYASTALSNWGEHLTSCKNALGLASTSTSWGANSGKDLIDSFVTALSSESGAQGAQGEASVRLAGTVADSYSRGKQLSDDDVLAIVKSKVGAGKPFALDAHGIYVLLTSADVTLSSGFCSQYCGWHTQDSLNSSPLRYAFVGHHGQCPDACGVESTSPNGKPAIDATISTLAHEITEAATDPDVNAGWFDAQGEENADLCSWSYGSTKTGTQQSGQTYRYNLHEDELSVHLRQRQQPHGLPVLLHQDRMTRGGQRAPYG
ncbi:hypothetical protein CLOM_g15253 [Closterium sp. NIES-68]|nr:hypothetical protein CLOM_g15253 [Closterium sp. NIES-68]